MSLIRQISRKAVVLQNTDAEVATSKTVTPYYEWVFNGELNFPIETALDTLHHTDASNTIYQVRITARQAGDSTYRFKIYSYDINGGDQQTHVDSLVTFTNDRRTALLPIADALLPSDRALEVRLFEEVVGAIPAKDVTISLTLGSMFEVVSQTDFLVQRADDTVLPRRTKLQFNDDRFEITDDLPNDRTRIEFNDGQVGDIVQSMLTEAQFQTLRGVNWVLMDGRSVTGSTYETITGEANIPDVRGTYLRSKDNGRGLDPDGDPNLGAYQEDQFQGHRHSQRVPSHDELGIAGGTRRGIYNSGETNAQDFIREPKTDTVNGTPRTGPETRPKSTIVNTFIKIN
jgi:hypothetical protein